ncbi:hypothetical protein BKA65DRAFT_16290 [Rhexocercosporidium sp. MPI-PUGE-AT-0058]|nr:hypothetical protein BKA65DRAFT_16290 [Rhexocercosporidium sp. MPI-PUGE-AT-0058]
MMLWIDRLECGGTTISHTVNGVLQDNTKRYRQDNGSARDGYHEKVRTRAKSFASPPLELMIRKRRTPPHSSRRRCGRWRTSILVLSGSVCLLLLLPLHRQPTRIDCCSGLGRDKTQKPSHAMRQVGCTFTSSRGFDGVGEGDGIHESGGPGIYFAVRKCPPAVFRDVVEAVEAQ